MHLGASMVAIEFELPGGLPRGEQLHRRVRLRPLTGRLELAIAEASQLDGIDAVDELLAAAIERIGELEASLALVRELCIADRNFAAVRVAAMLRGSRFRLRERCPDCALPIDLHVDLERFAVTPAGPGYPSCERQIAGRRVRLRVPTGEDQRASASEDSQQARLDLLDRCAELLDGEGDLNARVFDAIERAIETMSPHVVTKVVGHCRACRRDQSFTIDPIALARTLPGEPGVIGEIHTIAFHYHWSETDILSLPRPRRRLYLQQIERELAGRVAVPKTHAAAFERADAVEFEHDIPRPRTTPNDLREPNRAAPWVEYASNVGRR
jgi:hypothetical protein